MQKDSSKGYGLLGLRGMPERFPVSVRRYVVSIDGVVCYDCCHLSIRSGDLMVEWGVQGVKESVLVSHFGRVMNVDQISGQMASEADKIEVWINGIRTHDASEIIIELSGSSGSKMMFGFNGEIAILTIQRS